MKKNDDIAYFLLGWIKGHYDNRKNQHKTWETDEGSCQACLGYKAALKEVEKR